MKSKPRSRRSLLRVWTMPVLIGLSTSVGLVAALLADGLGDIASWLALGLPATVAIGFSLKRGD